MHWKKEIIISFCIITISASNLYMPMIRLYVFLLDFLIPFLCDPDLQCESGPPTPIFSWTGTEWMVYNPYWITLAGGGQNVFECLKSMNAIRKNAVRPSFSQKSHMLRHSDADIYKELTEEIPRDILGKLTLQIFFCILLELSAWYFYVTFAYDTCVNGI